MSCLGDAAVSASVSLTNTLGSSSQLVIHTEPPATAIAGEVFGTRPVVYVEDEHGNVQTGRQQHLKWR